MTPTKTENKSNSISPRSTSLISPKTIFKSLAMIALLALSMAEAKGQCNFSSSSSTSPTTCSGSDGTITINGLGNNKDYTINYSKNGSAVTPFTVTTNGDGKLVIPSLGAGSYTNVTATKGCTTSAISYTLSDPAAPSLGSISFISPSGCNTSDGSFSISSMSANTAYTVNYKKAGIAQTPVNTTSDASGKVTVTGLSAAAYTNITISKNNCTSGSSGSVTITNPAPPSLGGLSAVAPTTCGGTDAAWYISSMTPATTYTVNYSKNGVAQTAVNLYASNSGILTMSNQGTGSYTNITVSLNGCTSTSTGNVTINNPTAPSVGGLSSTVPTSCNGNSATMLISNMTANSAYTVNYKYNGVAANPSLTTASASGVITVYSLAPGTYTNITVTKNNCVSSSAGPLTISNAATSSIGSTSSSNPVTCSGTEGTITINGLTANTIYYVNYNKNSVAQTAMYVTTNGSGVGVMTGLGSGSYSNVNVSTVTSCPSSNAGPFTLSDPSAPSIGSSTVTNTTTCSGNDGSIKLNGLTAITTYTVNYNKNGVAQFAQNLTTNASGSLMVSSLSAATYSSFTVTKSNCTSAGFGPIVVSDPAAPSIGSSSTVNPTTCSSTNGSITLGGLSANTAYTVNYSKNGIAQTAINLTTNSSGNLIISSLSSATYNNFTVTKSNCTSAAYGPIVLAGAPIFTMSSGNPTTCSGTDGSITLSGLSASTSYTINYNKNGVAQTALTTPSNASGVITISGLTATTYSNLTVTKTGCSSSPMSSVVLTEPSAPTPIASYVNPSTCNGTNGSITLNNLIPSSSYTINYSKAGITQTPVVATSNASGVVVISNLSAGTYSSISATKSYCVSNLAGTITLSDPIAPSITSSNSGTVCQGSSISLSASTVSGATYSWSGPNGYSNSSQNPTITNASATQAGTYSVTATANNCISTVATTTVAVNTNTNPSISSANSVCAGASTTVTFTGAANSVVTYSVNNGSNQTVTLNNSGSGSISTGTLNTATTYNIVNFQSGSCNFPSSLIKMITVTANVWTGAADTNWNNPANWCGGVPTATTPILIPTTTNQPIISTGVNATYSNFTVSTGASITVNSNSAVNVTGNAVINGTVAGNGTVVLNGNSAQTVTGNGSVSNLQVNNTSGVTINTTDTLRVTGMLTLTSGTLNTNDVLVLASDSNGTGSIGAISNGTISGKVIQERFIPEGKRLYRFFSHPYKDTVSLAQELIPQIDVTGAGGAANGFTPTQTNNASAFWYNPLIGNLNPGANGNDPGWVAFTSANATSGANGWKPFEGIRVLVRGAKGEGLNGGTYNPSASKLRLIGRVNTGTVNIPIIKGPNSNCNIIGNPYPSTVNLGNIMYNAYQSGIINGAAYYVWDAEAGTSGAYITQHITSASNVYYLPSGAAFVVNAAANGNLTFHESDKVNTNGDGLFRTTSSTNNVVEFKVTSDNGSIYWDRMFISFNDNASTIKDNFDGAKASNPTLNFYSLSTDNKQLAVDARPFVNNMTIPLGFKTSVQKTYSIEIPSMDLPANYSLYLTDNFLNTVTTLQSGTSYSFDVTADSLSQAEGRFALNGAIAQANTTTGIVATSNKTTSSLTVTATPNPAITQTTISFTAAQKGNSTISVLKVNGQEVYNVNVGELAAAKVVVPVKDLAAGIYLIKVICGTEVMTQRLIKQ